MPDHMLSSLRSAIIKFSGKPHISKGEKGITNGIKHVSQTCFHPFNMLHKVCFGFHMFQFPVTSESINSNTLIITIVIRYSN